jgi:hypothetical protein
MWIENLILFFYFVEELVSVLGHPVFIFYVPFGVLNFVVRNFVSGSERINIP